MKPRILSFFNGKGGVSKTTSAINVAAGLALLGKKVLFFDFDPQANASSVFFGVDSIRSDESVYKMLSDDMNNIEIDYRNFIRTYERGIIKIDVIPSHINLAIAELDLMSRTGREFFLRRILEQIAGYDYIIIDSQPSLGVLVANILCCSDRNELRICVRADSFSRESIGIVFKSIASFQKNLGIRPKNYKILITQFFKGQKSDEANVAQIESDFAGKIFNSMIRKDTKIAQANDARCDIFTHDPKCNGATDYMKVVHEIIAEESNG